MSNGNYTAAVNAAQPRRSNFNRHSRSSDPQSSHEAAASVNTSHLESLILKTIRSFVNGCIMDDVVALHPDLSIVTISPRFATLIRKGLVIDTGFRRMGKAGRSQRVMIGAPV